MGAGTRRTSDAANFLVLDQLYLVRGGGRYVLIDTGIGAKDRSGIPNGRLPDALAEAGVQPAEVDIVLATHIHIDHVGWHTTAKDDAWVPTFPERSTSSTGRSTSSSPRPDSATNPRFLGERLRPALEGAAKVDWSGESRLTAELTLVPSPGHTPGHTSVVIASAGSAGSCSGTCATTRRR